MDLVLHPLLNITGDDASWVYNSRIDFVQVLSVACWVFYSFDISCLYVRIKRNRVYVICTNHVTLNVMIAWFYWQMMLGFFFLCVVMPVKGNGASLGNW